ncbi:kelch repeat protein [Teladorsagia circumcincta]|uniref:Kelch repeat protein n=1 Tax=Teladorsagia circumcincta TaxID=45464 RepID=A0A2G9UQ42_TELCI|nr:kelch repeat protein [Teladorsagia circumcincta]
MSTVRYYLGSAVIDDCIYAVGGVNDSNSPLSSAEKYDPRNNEWILLPAMNSKRYSEKEWFCLQLALAAVDEKLYAVGGINDTTEHDTVEVFDPKENEWKLHSRLSDRRKGLGAGVVWMP